MLRVVTDPRAAVRAFKMRPLWRWVILWFPYVWFAGAVVALFLGGLVGGTIVWAFIVLYGFGFVVLSRLQVVIVRLRKEGVLEFVSLARVVPIFLEDLVEVAPAPGPIQRRFATRFRGGARRVTVLSGMYDDFEQLLAEVERRSSARVVRY
jgi:hypothetical protein